MPGLRVADAKETALAQTRDHVAPHRVAVWDKLPLVEFEFSAV